MSKKGLCTTACRCLFLSQASTEAEWNSVVEDAVLHKGFEDVLGKAKNDFQSVNYRKRGTRERFHRGSGTRPPRYTARGNGAFGAPILRRLALDWVGCELQ